MSSQLSGFPGVVCNEPCAALDQERCLRERGIDGLKASDVIMSDLDVVRKGVDAELPDNAFLCVYGLTKEKGRRREKGEKRERENSKRTMRRGRQVD